MRQIEETAEHIVALAGPISFLLASDSFEEHLEQVLRESIQEDVPHRERALADIEKVMEILHARKATYRQRKPAVVSLISTLEIERFLRAGFVGRAGLPEPVVAERRAVARAEVEHFASVIENEPIGIQIGIVIDTLPHTGFQISRLPDRKILTISPFRLGVQPNVRVGVAMITSAPEALTLHEQAVQEMWRTSLRGSAAAEHLRALMSPNPVAAETAYKRSANLKRAG
jgi:hypothetical protein